VQFLTCTFNLSSARRLCWVGVGVGKLGLEVRLGSEDKVRLELQPHLLGGAVLGLGLGRVRTRNLSSAGRAVRGLTVKTETKTSKSDPDQTKPKKTSKRKVKSEAKDKIR
jgi:hypothetical protein